MNMAIVKGIGIATSVAGLGLNLVSDWVSDKKLDETVERKVNEVIAQKAKEALYLDSKAKEES